MAHHVDLGVGGGVPRSRKRLVEARDAFLTSGTVGPHPVREAIKASWLRSQNLRVATDRVDPAFVAEGHTAAPLAVNAAPVLGKLADELADEPVGIILTDAQGLVLQRVSGDSELGRRLDAASLAPGFNYAEENVGTNGIGTTLENRTATMVDGAEHYAGGLGRFSCAGAPIHHPVSGALLGVFDLTSLTRHSSHLLLAFAKSAAQQIEQQLLERASARELVLLRDYLVACQHTGGAVMALNNDVVMMNNYAQQRFNTGDQAALLARSADAAGAPGPLTLVVDLPSGLVARMEYRPAYTETSLAGGVFRIQLQTGLEQPSAGRQRNSFTGLPGLAGTSASWQRVCQAIDTSRRNGEWVVLEGEAGVGKLALVRAVHQLRNPTGHFRVMDAADAAAGDPEAWLGAVADELAEEDGTLVLRRAHLLCSEAVTGLSEILLQHADRRSPRGGQWVALTMSGAPRNAQVDGQLLPHFARTIEVPPLRHHIEDMHKLVPSFLERITRSDSLSLSPAALRQLMRLPWLGNVEQLRRVLVHVAQQRRSGLIDLDDLPPECHATSRRRLTQMESLERDAIVRALVVHQGNKGAAAQDLGMSRATIYRKIRDYGISLNARDQG